MRPVHFVLKNYKCPGLLRQNMVEAEFLNSARVYQEPQLRNATSQEIEVVGTVLLHVYMDEAHVRVVFRIV